MRKFLTLIYILNLLNNTQHSYASENEYFDVISIQKPLDENIKLLELPPEILTQILSLSSKQEFSEDSIENKNKNRISFLNFTQTCKLLFKLSFDHSIYRKFTIDSNELNYFLEQLQSQSYLIKIQNLRLININNESFNKVVKELKNLRILDLKGCRSITDDGILLLSENKSSSLKKIDLWETQITEIGINSLLNSFPSIVNLSLQHTEVRDKDLTKLPFFVNLKNLNLSACKNITAAGIENISNIENLRTLILARNIDNLTDEAIEKISHMQNLKTLDIGSCHLITDKSGLYISRISTLISLYLGYCNITDEWINNFIQIKLQNLNFLNLMGTKVTSSGIQKLKIMYPNIILEYDDNE